MGDPWRLEVKVGEVWTWAEALPVRKRARETGQKDVSWRYSPHTPGCPFQAPGRGVDADNSLTNCKP
ncbi:MAG TPA: hypothetical protein DET40_04660 [Lentisphaeria bacterium]|nr:MAG: hypothetical protein A2X45_21465 [Lentisphaerae bacterium GWF2_50_93]HCE42816.1 hypothetical protein [Lentisphaeria bacterium]